MGLSINIAQSEKYAGPVSFSTARMLCGDALYKMGGTYIGIEGGVSFEFDSVIVTVGKRSQSLIFDMISALKMESASMEKTKSYKVKKLPTTDYSGKEFVIYKIV